MKIPFFLFQVLSLPHLQDFFFHLEVRFAFSLPDYHFCPNCLQNPKAGVTLPVLKASPLVIFGRPCETPVVDPLVVPPLSR